MQNESQQLLEDESGNLVLHPAKAVRNLPWEYLRIWMHYKAVYGVPTQELVQFLKEEIGTLPAIEIGSGCTGLGRFLSIKMTDAKIQDKQAALYYAVMNQPTIKYPEDVEAIEALDAIELYKPNVVIGSWITRWIDPSKPLPEDGFGGNMYGVKEDIIISNVDKYIHIGSEAIHAYKLKLKPTRILKPDWLVSRGSVRKDDVIYIWEKELK
jgi:hypothetical protein